MIQTHTYVSYQNNLLQKGKTPTNHTETDLCIEEHPHIPVQDQRI